MTKIRIVLASHHPIVRTTLRGLLEKEAAFEIVGEAANGREAIALADYRSPDVVLLDIHLPLVNGISATTEILSRSARTGIAIVSSFADEEYVVKAFQAGVRGYVHADSAQADLAAAVLSIARGEFYLSPSIASHLSETTASSLLNEGRANC